MNSTTCYCLCKQYRNIPGVKISNAYSTCSSVHFVSSNVMVVQVFPRFVECLTSTLCSSHDELSGGNYVALRSVSLSRQCDLCYITLFEIDKVREGRLVDQARVSAHPIAVLLDFILFQLILSSPGTVHVSSWLTKNGLVLGGQHAHLAKANQPAACLELGSSWLMHKSA
jgi:hypothetical protein